MRKSIQKLLDAYQEDLLQLDELRDRMPELRKREEALKSGLHSLEDAAEAHNAFLRVSDNLENFLLQLSKTADTMSVTERQKVLRLVVKEILVDEDAINIIHSIPFTRSSTPGESKVGPKLPGYLVRSGSHLAVACQHLPALVRQGVLSRRRPGPLG